MNPRREEVSLAGFTTSVIAPAALDTLVDALRTRGYRVLGPTTREGAIVYDELQSAAELSIDREPAATYRLERRDDATRFGYAVGPHSWKQFLFPSRIRLWQARRFSAGDELSPEVTAAVPGVAEARREEVAACTSRR